MSASKHKKSETIEIRLSHEAKTAFMARCRRDQRTASEAIRLFIDSEGDSSPKRGRRIPNWRIAAAGMIGVALGVAAAPSLAHTIQPSPDHGSHPAPGTGSSLTCR